MFKHRHIRQSFTSTLLINRLSYVKFVSNELTYLSFLVTKIVTTHFGNVQYFVVFCTQKPNFKVKPYVSRFIIFL